MSHYLITSKNIFEQTRLLAFIENELEQNVYNPYHSKIFRIKIHNSTFIELKVNSAFSINTDQLKSEFPGIKIVQKISYHNTTKYITI